MKIILLIILFLWFRVAGAQSVYPSWPCLQLPDTPTVYRVYLIYSDTSNTKGVMFNVNLRHMMGRMTVGGQIRKPVYTDKKGKALPKNYTVWMALTTK